MTELTAFQFPTNGTAMRTVMRGGEPWFVAADACSILDLGNPRSSVALLDEDERDVHSMDTPSGQQRVGVISESGLYSLILRSRKPEAKAFKKWVTAEVLPSLRKTGRYEIAQLTGSEVARRWYEAELAREAVQQQLAIAAPKADAWDVLSSAAGDYSVREAAHILNRDPALSTGQQRLFVWLRDAGWIDRHDVPYQAHERHVVLRTYSHDGFTRQQVRITAAGLGLLHRRLGGTSPLAELAAATA